MQADLEEHARGKRAGRADDTPMKCAVLARRRRNRRTHAGGARAATRPAAPPGDGTSNTLTTRPGQVLAYIQMNSSPEHDRPQPVVLLLRDLKGPRPDLFRMYASSARPPSPARRPARSWPDFYEAQVSAYAMSERVKGVHHGSTAPAAATASSRRATSPSTGDTTDGIAVARTIRGRRGRRERRALERRPSRCSFARSRRRGSSASWRTVRRRPAAQRPAADVLESHLQSAWTYRTRRRPPRRLAGDRLTASAYTGGRDENGTERGGAHAVELAQRAGAPGVRRLRRCSIPHPRRSPEHLVLDPVTARDRLRGQRPTRRGWRWKRCSSWVLVNQLVDWHSTRERSRTGPSPTGRYGTRSGKASSGLLLCSTSGWGRCSGSSSMTATIQLWARRPGWQTAALHVGNEDLRPCDRVRRGDSAPSRRRHARAGAGGRVYAAVGGRVFISLKNSRPRSRRGDGALPALQHAAPDASTGTPENATLSLSCGGRREHAPTWSP